MIAVCIFSDVAATAQTSSSSISGTVLDSKGALVPGASVTVTQVEQNVSLKAETDAHGHYVFPVVIPGTYMVTIEAPGFKKDVETGLAVDPNSNVTAPDAKLAVGAATEVVTVTASGPQIELDTAERSDNVVHNELLDLPIDSGAASGRSFMGAMALVPGVASFEASSLSIYINGAQYHENNATLDGILNVDAGGNGGILVDLNADNVGEMHVSTHDGGAEYGRQQNTIAVTTASGTSQFHGEGTWFHRHEDLNANSWGNKRTGTITARNRNRLNEFSGNFGGPVEIPHLYERFRNKMFFFIGEDWQQPLLAQGNKYINLPTYAESVGDFSQSHNKNGSPFYLTDYTKNAGKCTSANTVANPGGCFVGISPVTGMTAINVIPKAEQSTLGQAILGIYKNYIPTAGYLGYPSAGNYGARGQEQTGQNSYNYSDGISDSEDYRQDVYRLDFNPGPSWQTHIRWANLVLNKTTYYGATYSDTTNLPTTEFLYQTPGDGIAIGATKIFNSTTTNEATVGFNVGKIHGAPSTTALSKTTLGIENIPLQFNSAVQDQSPDLEFGGSNLTDSPDLITNDAPYRNANTAIDLLDNFTKIIGRHEIQAGVQYERLRKDQYNAGTPGGLYQFGDDTNNPLDTSDAYANAITGVFDTFAQQSAWKDGKYRYGAFDFYGQDTWKVVPRLTVVAGLRVQHWSPWYDSSLQSLNFEPSMYNSAAAPRLYYPTATGSTDLGAPGSSFPKAYANLIVPGSGNIENGMVAQAGAKYTNNLGTAIPTTSKYLFNAPKFLYSPHLGFTFDVFGNQKTVLRMGSGAFYDRYSGNTIFNMLNNPPSVLNPTVYYSTFSSLSSVSGLIGAPSILSVGDGMKYPVTWQFNADVQQQLKYHTVLTVAYVGSSSSHLEQNPNLNHSPYGSTFQAANQNPAGTSTIPGANAYAQVLLNTYRGFGTITHYQSGASSNFNSMQVSVNHSYANGLFLKSTYIWSKVLGTTSADSGSVDFLGRTRQLDYTPTNYDRRQTLTVTYSYTLPSLFRNSDTLHSTLHAIADGWELSGNTTLWGGNPISFGQTVYFPGTTTSMGSANLTGSYTEGARIQLISDPFHGVSRGNATYGRLNPAAFQASPGGSLANPLAYTGLGMRGNQYYGPGIDNSDMSLQKNFSLHSEGARLQLRADAFNVFNHNSFSGYNTTITFSGPGVVGNAFYQPTTGGTTYPNIAAQNNTGGFGGVSGANANRVVALMARIRF
jgi:hypothetical protein